MGKGILVLGATLLALVLCVPATSQAASDPGADGGPGVGLQLPLLSVDPNLATAPGLAHHGHRHTYRRRYYRSRYYRPTHSHTVVVQDPGPVVVTDPPLRKKRQGFRGLSLTLRTVGISYGDTRLNSGTLKGNDVAGLGIGLRAPLDRHWSLEFAADLLEGTMDDDSANITVLPMTASLMAHLFPSSNLDIYGLGGVGIHRTAIQRNPGLDESYTQLGAHFGMGLELKLGHLLLTGDIRYLVLQNRPDPVRTDGGETAENSLRTAAEEPASTEGQDQDQVEDDLNTGIQGMLAIGYRW
jgi:hypothetical protein